MGFFLSWCAIPRLRAVPGVQGQCTQHHPEQLDAPGSGAALAGVKQLKEREKGSSDANNKKSPHSAEVS